jgi:hypothetical protein
MINFHQTTQRCIAEESTLCFIGNAVIVYVRGSKGKRLKLSMCIVKHHPMKTDAAVNALLISVSDDVQMSAARPCRFTQILVPAVPIRCQTWWTQESVWTSGIEPRSKSPGCIFSSVEEHCQQWNWWINIELERWWVFLWTIELCLQTQTRRESLWQCVYSQWIHISQCRWSVWKISLIVRIILKLESKRPLENGASMMLYTEAMNEFMCKECVCLFCIHIHTVALILTEIDMVVYNLSGEVSDTRRSSQNFGTPPPKTLFWGGLWSKTIRPRI